MAARTHQSFAVGDCVLFQRKSGFVTARSTPTARLGLPTRLSSRACQPTPLSRVVDLGACGARAPRRAQTIRYDPEIP